MNLLLQRSPVSGRDNPESAKDFAGYRIACKNCFGHAGYDLR
jgi:hypothetical protein